MRINVVIALVLASVVGFGSAARARGAAADISCSIDVSVNGSTVSLFGEVVGPKIEGHGGAAYSGVIVVDGTFIVQGNGDAGAIMSASPTYGPGNYTAYTRGSNVEGAQCEASRPFSVG